MSAPDDIPIADWEDHTNRFVEAVALGQIADTLFEKECRRRRLVVDVMIQSPLDSLLSPPTGGRDVRH